MSAPVSTEPLTDKDIVTTRLLDAPRELVVRAWTEPEHLAQWWGPAGFTNTFQTFEPRPAGSWRFVMHGPNGVDYPNECVFLEVTEKRISFDHLSRPHFRGTATFTDEGGGTRFTYQGHFASAEECARLRPMATAANVQLFDRLEQELAAMAGGEAFVISRVLDAPRERVFNAWTDPEEMRRWWGPEGFKVIHSQMDLRPEGIYHYGLQGPASGVLWGKFVFREIRSPERLVFVNSFSDEGGGVTRHPLSPTWPLELLSTITFAEQAGQTLVTVRWAPLNATREERQTFANGRASMQQGWTGTLDQLTKYLAGG